MRREFTILMILTAAGCASDPPPPRGFGPGGEGPPRQGFFISVMGEPFRSQEPGADLIGQWFAAADINRDDRLNLAELEQDAARFFRTLDLDGDGEIAPAEMSRYENEVAPEIRLASRMRGGPGGGRGPGRAGGGRPPGPPGGGPGGRGGGRGGFGGASGPRPGSPGGVGLLGVLNLPQPVAAADADMNRGVSVAEFRRAAGQRFLWLDRSHDGAVTRDELVPAPPQRPNRR